MVLAHNIEKFNRTSDIQILQDVTFETMLLTSDTLNGLKQCGFYKPSPVQLHGIPLGKCGFDLLLEAKSGTGKTAVFTVLTLEKLDLNKGLQSVILAPTREIASQICDVIRQIGSHYQGLCVEVVMGGLPVEEDILKFKKKVHVVVGSPGRLRHLIQDQHIDISAVRLLILDEADKLMEKSFQADINFIFSMLPIQKQVIMSSATYPEATKSFINKYVKSAQHVCPANNCVLLGVDQKITCVRQNTSIVKQTKARYEELIKILTKIQFKQCLIFCNYQVRVGELYKYLTRDKWPVEQLYGKQEQVDRLDALRILKEYKCRILVSTDLGARGIDASNVDLVVNFEPPHEWQTYLHRIGRAGRYGSYGISITILSEGKEVIDFNKMLESLNLKSLHIGSLWTDDNPDNYDSTTHIVSPNVDQQSKLNTNKLEDAYKDIWNDLICESTGNEIEKLEEFDTLCKSFKESNHTKIESFSDLLNSFEENKNIAPNETETFHHIKVKSKAIKSFLESMKALQDGNYAEKNKVTEKESPKKEANNNVPDMLSNEHKTEIINKSNSDLQNCNMQLKINGFGLSNDVISVNPVNMVEENVASHSQALIDAGFPTSFGSSKKHFTSKKRNRRNKRNSRSDNTKESQGDLDNMEHPKDTIEKSNKKIQYATQPYEKLDPQSSKLCQEIQCDPPKIKQKYPKQKKYSISTVDTDILNERKAQDVYAKDYLDWYYQLKSRVKQIEIALYIEEMSKL